MAVFQGAVKDKLSPEQRVDTRRWSVRMAEAWSNPEEATFLALFLTVVSLITYFIPFGGILISPATSILSNKFLYHKKRLHNVPYRVPLHLNMPDGSTGHTAGKFNPKNPQKFWGKGTSMYGQCRETGLQVWGTDGDDRVHGLILGTTGSGKSEIIHTLLFNQLLNNSGFLVVDAKGDIAFQRRINTLLRRLGREDDLLTITFAVGRRDFSKAQFDKPSNTFNIMADNSAGMLIEILSGMLDASKGGNDAMWVGRAVTFVAAVTNVLVFLRNKGEIELSPSVFLSYMELAEIERLVENESYLRKYPEFSQVAYALRQYLLTLPGYVSGRTPGNQSDKTNEQFGYITMQLTRAFNDLAFNYGHIFADEISDIDISDVVFNRRCMTVLLPSLERSLPTLNMLSKLIIASIKQMMAGSLGSTLEGSVRIIVDSRPTSADSAFRVVLDEAGYMMSEGMSIIPAQARSIFIAMTFAAQSYSDIKRGSPEEAEAIWANCNMKFIGKLADGDQSETVQKIKGIVGEVEQTFIDGYHSRETATGGITWRSSGHVRRERRSAVDWQDLAGQSDGQFHMIVQRVEDGGKRAGARVIRMTGLFTGDGNSMNELYLNSFVPISKLGSENTGDDVIVRLSKAIQDNTIFEDLDDLTDNLDGATKDLAVMFNHYSQSLFKTIRHLKGLDNYHKTAIKHILSYNQRNYDAGSKNIKRYHQEVVEELFEDEALLRGIDLPVATGEVDEAAVLDKMIDVNEKQVSHKPSWTDELDETILDMVSANLNAQIVQAKNAEMQERMISLIKGS